MSIKGWARFLTRVRPVEVDKPTVGGSKRPGEPAVLAVSFSRLDDMRNNDGESRRLMIRMTADEWRALRDSVDNTIAKVEAL